MQPGATRWELHFQADRIELVLASHKVPARVTGAGGRGRGRREPLRRLKAQLRKAK